jgi:excisionase family DNA binding protein
MSHFLESEDEQPLGHLRGGVLVFDVAPPLAGHLAVALQTHLKWLRRSQLREPEGLQDMVDLFRMRASGGQRVTAVDALEELRDATAMAPLLITYEQAARSLSCSPRQVKRLIAAGDLAAVRVGGLARIRVTDLTDYTHGLTSRRNA